MILRYAASCSLFMLAALFVTDETHAQAAPAPEEKKDGTMVRIVCVQSLGGTDEEITLAKQTEDGKWNEFGDLELRSPFITDWVRVPSGLNHVARKEGAELSSIGSFTISPAIKGAVLILLPDKEKKAYRVQLIDPAKLKFGKGKALIINYSKLPAMVNMGKQTQTVVPGQQVVENITPDGDGMYRLLIAHMDKDKKIIPCYDRFVSSNPNTRKFILLFPDPDTGIRAMSLSEFGPFE